MSHYEKVKIINNLNGYEVIYLALGDFAAAIGKYGAELCQALKEDNPTMSAETLEKIRQCYFDQAKLVRSLIPAMAKLDAKVLELTGDDLAEWKELYPLLK